VPDKNNDTYKLDKTPVINVHEKARIPTPLTSWAEGILFSGEF